MAYNDLGYKNYYLYKFGVGQFQGQSRNVKAQERYDIKNFILFLNLLHFSFINPLPSTISMTTFILPVGL